MGLDLRSRCPQGDGSDRADFHTFAAVLARGHGFLVHPIETDHGIKTPFGKNHLRMAFLGSADADAPSAKNTAVGIIVDERMLFYNVGFLEQPFESFRLKAQAEEFGYVLEAALLIGWAMSAIHIVNREQ